MNVNILRNGNVVGTGTLVKTAGPSAYVKVKNTGKGKPYVVVMVSRANLEAR